MIDPSLGRYAEACDAPLAFAEEFGDPPWSKEAKDLLAKISADFDRSA